MLSSHVFMKNQQLTCFFVHFWVIDIALQIMWSLKKIKNTRIKQCIISLKIENSKYIFYFSSVLIFCIYVNFFFF